MANQGANPLKVLEDNLPAHLEDLKARRAKLAAELFDVNTEIAKTESHLAIAPQESEKPVKSGARPSAGDP